MTESFKNFVITVPTRVKVSNKKQKSLNLNIYRNLNYFSLNTQKKNFKTIVKNEIKKIPKLGKIDIHYEIFHNTKAIIDTMNVGSIVNKFFEDALVELGVIPDDNYLYIRNHSFSFGGLSDKPKAIVTITEIEPTTTQIKKDKNMRIILEENEIKDALENYVSNVLNMNLEEVTLNINHSEESFEVELIVGNEVKVNTSNTTDTQAKPKRRGRPKGSKNATKAEPIKDTTSNDNPTNAENSDNSDSSGSDKPTKKKLGLFSEDETEEKSTTNKSQSSESKKSKNLFEDSPEESCETENSDKTEEKTETNSKIVEPKKVKSIFDED